MGPIGVSLAPRLSRRLRVVLFTAALIARFWSKVVRTSDPDGCWLWGDSCNAGGYGHFTLRGRWYRAHRVMYELVFGPIPQGKVVCHRCGVRSCVRPSHLFVGSQRDNIRDAVGKGRAARGELNGQAKLTAADVRRIRTMLAAGRRQSDIASLFGVRRTEISRIATGSRWAHI